MRGSTTAVLALLGAASAGVAAYLTRGKGSGVQLLAAGVAFALPWAVHAATASPTCSFLYITDTHGSAIANQKLVQAMLAENDISFVAHGGDVADAPQFWDPWWDSGFQQVRERWPVYAASGNHDVDTTANAAEFATRFGELPMSVRCGTAELFFMPWGVTRASAEWLWAAVAGSDAPVKILVVHKPVWPMRDDDTRQREMLMPVMDRIDLVLSGHEHVYQDSTHDGVRQIVEVSGPKKYECPADARGCVSHSTGYLRIDVYDDSFRVYRKVIV